MKSGKFEVVKRTKSPKEDSAKVEKCYIPSGVPLKSLDPTHAKNRT